VKGKWVWVCWRGSYCYRPVPINHTHQGLWEGLLTIQQAAGPILTISGLLLWLCVVLHLVFLPRSFVLLHTQQSLQPPPITKSSPPIRGPPVDGRWWSEYDPLLSVGPALHHFHRYKKHPLALFFFFFYILQFDCISGIKLPLRDGFWLMKMLSCWGFEWVFLTKLFPFTLKTADSI